MTDDIINEVEQSFALTAEIGDDVPDNCYVAGIGLTDCSCFQTQAGAIPCFGRSGATEIRISDNDRKNNILLEHSGTYNYTKQCIAPIYCTFEIFSL